MEQELDQVGNMADNLVSAMQPSLRDRLAGYKINLYYLHTTNVPSCCNQM